MRFDLVIAGLLVVTVFFVGGLSMINEFRTSYDNSTGVNFSVGEYEGSLNYIQDSFGVAKEAEDDIVGLDIQGTDQSWESMTKGSYSGVRSVAKNSFGLVNNLSYTTANILDIPSVYVKLGFVAFIILGSFSLIYMVFRFRP